MMPVRRLSRSNMGNIGWLSSAMNMVGTPYSAVHFSFWTDASTSSGSKLSMITAVAPCVTMAIIPSTRPKQWKSGTGRHTRSAAVNFCRSPMWNPLLMMLWCVSITPLGKPVVPEVYCMLITSWHSRPASVRARLVRAGVAAQEEELRGGVHAAMLFRAHEDHGLQPGKRRAGELSPLAGGELGDQLVHHGYVVAVTPAVDQAQGLDVGLRDQVLQLMRAVGRVDGHGDNADLGGGKEEGEPVGNVGGPDPEVIARAKADAQQAARQVVHTAVEIRVGKAQVAVRKDHEVLVRRRGGLPLQHGTEGLRDVLDASFHGAYTTASTRASAPPALCTW